MSNATGGNGVTSSQSPTGIQVIQVSDFYQRAGILHPITVGAIAIILLFFYLRVSSNRCVAPVTVFDWIINVALGSTLAGIVNGTSLTRGLIALATLLAFQFLSSHMSSHFGPSVEHMLSGPPLVIAFRGRALTKVMRKHRISATDLNGALRRNGVWNIEQVEVVIIEPTGAFSIFKRDDMPKDFLPNVLLNVPGYQKLVDEYGQDPDKEKQRRPGNRGREDSANDIAADAA